MILRQPLYVARPSKKRGEYDVICLGPHEVAIGLKPSEAEALAKALNEENKDR